MTNETAAAFKAALGAAIGDDAATDRAMDVITKHIPVAITEALQAPAMAKTLTEQVVAPAIEELEEMLYEQHDDPKTPEALRAGLRVAARTIRTARRELWAEAQKQQQRG